jgi:hypothetical protein
MRISSHRLIHDHRQTETGSIVVTPFPGAIETKPGSATVPFFGIEPVILDPVSGQVQFHPLHDDHDAYSLYEVGIAR